MSGTVTDYFYSGSVVVSEKQGSNWTDYIFFGSQRIVKQTGSSLSTATFIHTDHLNSTRVCTDSSGNSTGSCNYEPFGEYQGGSCSLPVNYRYAGMEWDSETQLYHTWFRQYDISQGRWMSVDPLAGSANDPQSVNRYTYVLNDPANLTDPLGLFPCPLDNIGDPDRSYAGCDPYGNFRFHGGPRMFEGFSVLAFQAAWGRVLLRTKLANTIRRNPTWSYDDAQKFLWQYGMTLKPVLGPKSGRLLGYVVSEMYIGKDPAGHPDQTLGEYERREIHRDNLVSLFDTSRLSTVASSVPTQGPLFPRRTPVPFQLPALVDYPSPPVPLHLVGIRFPR